MSLQQIFEFFTSLFGTIGNAIWTSELNLRDGYGIWMVLCFVIAIVAYVIRLEMRRVDDEGEPWRNPERPLMREEQSLKTFKKTEEYIKWKTEIKERRRLVLFFDILFWIIPLSIIVGLFLGITLELPK